MATAIDATYFTGAIILPNTASNYPEGQQLLQFINTFEPKFLDLFFGVTLANLVQGEIDTPANVELAKIVNGTMYQDRQNVTKRWIGLKNASLQSPIANYVYFELLRQRDSSTTGIGEMFQVSQNAVRGDAGGKSTRAWNQMVDWLINLHEFLEINKDSVTEFADYKQNYELLTYTTRFGL